MHAAAPSLLALSLLHSCIRAALPIAAVQKAGRVDAWVVSDQELIKLMKDRDEWRLRVRVIVLENK